MVNSKTIKGFKDVLGTDARKREKIIRIIKETFENYGFEPAETPIIESEEFVRGENSNDEAVRDIYKLTDRGNRNLALRYEFTFQLKRIAKKQKLPFKRYQIGYNFRDEPIREGRVRQFIQADADIVGSTKKEEAENFKLISDVFEKLNVPIRIFVNNRKLINEILVDCDIEEKYRSDVIRAIDKLDKQPKKKVAEELQKYNAEKVLKIVTGSQKELESYGAFKEIKELESYCQLFGVKIEFRPFIARGFSYYNGTVFEVWSEKLKVSIMGGGSYMIDDVQATGISFGIEPITLLTEIEEDNINYIVISMNQEKTAIKVAETLRKKNNKVLLLMDKTLKKSLEYANAKKIEQAVIIGEEEVSNNIVTIKDLKTGSERTVNQKDL